MAYTPYGPFSDGEAPGIQAAFLNAQETFLESINSAATSPGISGDSNGNITVAGIQTNGNVTSLNGSTSGTATARCIIFGGVVITQVYLNNFRNGGGSAQTLTLPKAYASLAQGWNGGCGLYQLKVGSGSALSVQVQTGFNATSDGTVSAQTTLRQNSMWHIDSGFDTISFNGSDPSAHHGLIFIAGV